MATDPHMCTLGKWYDKFTAENDSKNGAVLFHLKKMEDPHARLHHAAEEAELCRKECDICQRDECLKQILSCAKAECKPAILKLLDETKDIFHSSVYREMFLLLDGMKWGIVVDEIEEVHELEIIEERERESVVNKSSYILNVL